ncbi:MAG: hypothetical protein IPJ78_19065 [Gemmatimonadetes bacterium]|nr:hypothetical protein [Gemmatimonadota bacterium]
MLKDEDFFRLGVIGAPPPKVVWLNGGGVVAAAVAPVMQHIASATEEFVEHPGLGFLAIGVGPLVG